MAVLEHADADGSPAAVAGLVECALREAPVEQYGGPSGGDKQAVALLHLAAGMGGAEGAAVLARAAPCADDGRVLAAIAYRAEPPVQAEVAAAAVAAFRAVEQHEAGAVVHLVTLAGLGDEAVLLAEAAEAGRRQPAKLGDLARGEMRSFWPHVAMPVPATTASALWELTRNWGGSPRLELRARLAPCLPAGQRAPTIHAVLDEIGRMVDGHGASASVGHALAALAPHLDPVDIEVAAGLLPHLASPWVVEAVALRQLELGKSVDPAFALLERLREGPGYWYWDAMAQALALREDRELADALADHLEARDDSPASHFIEAHAQSLARGLDTHRLLAIVAAMAPEESVLGRGALAPYLPARRDELLAEALATADSLSPCQANMHIFVSCAPWLSERDAKWVLARLLGMHTCRGEVLIGDDGPYLFPGVAQLVPLLNRLGGTATLLETAQIVASL